MGCVTGIPLNDMEKKLLLCIILMAFFGGVLRAQGPHEIHISIAGPASGYLHGFDSDVFYDGGTDLYSMYEKRRMSNSFAAFSIGYSYALRGWLRPGIEACLGCIWVDEAPPRAFGNDDIQSFRQEYYTLLPFVNLMALDKPHIKIYGKVGVGGQLSAGDWEGTAFYPAWQIIPLGLQWGGERVFALFEMGYGNVYLARIGVGIRW